MNSPSDRSPRPRHVASPRIAILRALYLGDLLCTVPAFRALRCRFPEARIDLIGLPWAADIVERLPYLDRLLVFPGYDGLPEVPFDPDRTDAFFAYLRGKYDLVLQMHGDGRISNGFVAALAAPVSAGYGYTGDTRLRLSLPYRRDEHEVRRWLRLAAAVGAPSDDERLEFPTAPHERDAAGELLDAAGRGTGPLIGMHAGAKDPARRWPAERFAAMADRLYRAIGATVVLTGSASERSLTAAIAARAPAVVDLAGRTDLGLLAAVLARLDLLITNDTGASHMAAATRTPSVVLFGPGRAAEWAPLDSSLHRVLDARQYCDDPRSALPALPLEPVWQAAMQCLSARSEVSGATA